MSRNSLDEVENMRLAKRFMLGCITASVLAILGVAWPEGFIMLLLAAIVALCARVAWICLRDLWNLPD